MIEYCRGILISKQPHRAVVEVQGVAFEVLIPFSTFKQLGEAGSTTQLLCHLHWREEGPQLFGFLQDNERALFRLLTRVNKVGPKLALNIMSSCAPEKLVEMILMEDLTGLTALKGVGGKIASRLVVELKDLVAKLGIGGQIGETTQTSVKPSIPFEIDVREALENLGYTGREIDRALKESGSAISPQATVQEVLETILRSFSR